MMTLRRNIIKNVLLLAGFALSSGYVDLSRDKTSSQSSTRYCQASVCDSSNAVDRDENTCTGIRVIGEGTPDMKAWWRVDMGDIYSVYSISIMFKEVPAYEDRQRGRFAGFSLYLSESGNRENNSLCYKDGPDLPPLYFTTTTCIGYGRYVIFYNERLDRVDYPAGYETQAYTDLCEVIVKGCYNSSYGRNCNKICSVNCKDQRCNIVNGTCLICKPGWTGNSCENKCPKGWYGIGCEQQCTGHCLNNDVCNHVNGRCDNGCAGGWMGNTCEEPCKDGNYGPGCIYNCSDNCLHDVACDRETGRCNTGCKPGYRGNLCNTACIPGYYGNQCKELCSQNCLNDKTCNHIDGVCTDGCRDGFDGERCDECSNKTSYGRNCNKECSFNCENQRCNIVDGACLRCKAGWTGNVCDYKCSRGWYGLDCKQQCSSHCMNSEVCNHVIGGCDNGCAHGWIGINCDEPCKDGNYGPGCIYNCSDNCLHDAACDKQTGHCNTGCKPGYRGNLCNTACMPGYYGNQCKEHCSQNCLNDKTCIHIDGVCKGGCKNGYVGERCDESCQHGYFGKNCTGICSVKCISTCKLTDGSCDCSPGWRGPNCSEECLTGDFGVNCQHRCSGHCIQNESCSRFDGSCPRGCKTPYMGLRCEYNYLPVSRAVDDDRNHIAITIGFGVSQTINMIALSAFVFLFRGRILKIFRRRNNERPPDENVAYETQNVQEVSVNKSDYQELTVSRDNTEYQSNQMSDIPSSEEGNTYQNLAFTAV